jgi:hypothetical protein
MKFTTFVMVLLLTAPFSACSPTSRSNADTQKMVDEFFGAYQNSHKDAIVSLLSKNKWITTEDTNKLVGQIDQLATQIGKYQGYEKLSESHYGNSILQSVYVAKYERQPVKFIFRFYKPGDTWEFQSFNYEIDFLNEVGEKD